MAEYRRQHLVSQVVQRRFTRDSGPAAKRMFGISRSAPEQLQEARPRSSLKEDWFIDADPGRFEQAWGEIESPAQAPRSPRSNGSPPRCQSPPRPKAESWTSWRCTS
jgi:hypothetical protein